MLCLIQSRLTSRRLPNKALIKVNKKEILLRVVDQVRMSKRVKKIYVLIPDTKENLKIKNLLKRKKINYFEGNEANVYNRYYSFLKKKKFKSFLRISADSPLIDPSILDRLILIYSKHKSYDLITNIFPRTFPKGQSAEIVKTKSFLNIERKKLNKYDKEHVTSYFYKNYKKYKIKNMSNREKIIKYNFSIDTKADLKKISKIIHKLEINKKKINLKNINNIC